MKVECRKECLRNGRTHAVFDGETHSSIVVHCVLVLDGLEEIITSYGHCMQCCRVISDMEECAFSFCWPADVRG